MTKSHATPAMRRVGKPNLWTLPIEPQFNAAAGMLFRTMILFGFPHPRMANAIFPVPFRPQNGTSPRDCSETRE
jgi:hypothetical protein